MNTQSTVDPQEVLKFEQHATHWWDKEGPLKTLHHINPLRLDFISNQVELKNKTVLDVGCGGGLLSEGLSLLGAKVTGLDVEKESLETARYHANLNKLAIDYVLCPLEDYSAECFDVITCMEMLEHVQEPQQIIYHCARLLKPGGVLFLSTINRTLKSYTTAIVAAEYVLKILPKQTHDFKKFIKPSELATYIRAANLELKMLKGMAYNPWSGQAMLQDNIDVNYLVSCKA